MRTCLRAGYVSCFSRWHTAGARGPVDLDRYALRVGSRFDQVKRHVRAVGGEQPGALAQDHRDDEQGHLVHEVVLEQPPDQGTAAVHLQLTRPFGLQFADRRREVTGQDGRVRPLCVGERVRRDVLRPCVQGTYDGVLQVFPHAPVPGEELVGPPAEQERVGALVRLVDERQGLVITRPHGPPAALESVPAVLIRSAAVSLHHSIDGDLRHGRQSHGRGSLLLGTPLGGGLSPLPRTPLSRSDTASRTSSENFWHACYKRSGRATVSGRLRSLPCAQVPFGRALEPDRSRRP